MDAYDLFKRLGSGAKFDFKRFRSDAERLKVNVCNHFRSTCARVKPGFIGRQGSSDRSFYVSFTALPTDTCLERSYPFVLATNLLSDTAVKICIARVITLCSHWIKASSEKTRLVLKGFLQNGAEKKTSRFVTGLL